MICFCRIDDRLIHGQVVTTWVNKYQIEQIIVVNDKVAGDAIQKNILNMAAPQGIKVHAFGVKQFAGIYQKNPIKRRTMLLFTTSTDVNELVKAGVPIEELNIGGMRFQEGREQISRALSVTPEERAAFVELLDAGMKITIQMVPNDEKVDLKGVI
jgi:PTS system mannose-specific IIB component